LSVCSNIIELAVISISMTNLAILLIIKQMKRFTASTALAILFVGLLILLACRKKTDEPAATGPVPVVLTVGNSHILLTTAYFTGNITSDGGAFVNKRGFCYSNTNLNPTVGDDTVVTGSGAGPYSGTIRGLKGQSTAYVRAYATNSNGTGYGATYSIQTIDSTVTDIDNNLYHLVQIGTQVWMRENLKTTHYKNAEYVFNAVTASDWSVDKGGAYCNFNNDAANAAVYGRLYNFYAISGGNLAPAGWHVPTDTEWNLVMTYLGGSANAGGKLKETGQAHWSSPNYGATNESGFTAVGGGYRDDQGVFESFLWGGNYWLNTVYNSENSLFILINSQETKVYGNPWLKGYGYSIRCLRD
jgi:uncharacterized protein (TIGR02145 family)